MSIKQNLEVVHQRIAVACDRAGRPAADVLLIAVSKKMPVEALQEAYEAGVRNFGENRVEEASLKIPAFNALVPEPPVWHMIGNIQSRKASPIPLYFDYVHSVDRLKIAEKLSHAMTERNGIIKVLLEFNVSGEATKEGLSAYNWETDAALRSGLFQNIRQISALSGLQIEGLMTMAPYTMDAEETRPVFRSLAALRLALQAELGLPLPVLSMGMSNDYPVAIEEGATMVRVGQAIFGPRQ